MVSLWDTHIHSCFSGDSKASPFEIIQAALAKKLKGICFTDHEDLDYPLEPELFLLDFAAYQKETARLADLYQNQIPVLFGIELGLQPHIANENQEIISHFPFDFVIASSHVVDGIDPYYPPYFKEHTEEEGIRRYFESILENIAVFGDFDVYGHLDYIVRYAPNRNQNYTYRQYSDIIDEILRRLIAKGKGIEINSAGFTKGLCHPNPTEEILSRYRELGGEIITIGSDAHTPEHIAYAFEKVPDILKKAGFQYYTVFKQRIPEFLPL